MVSETVPSGLHKIEPFLFLNCSYCGYRSTQESTVNLALGLNTAVKRQTAGTKRKESREQTEEPEEHKDKDVEYNGGNCRMQ